MREFIKLAIIAVVLSSCSKDDGRLSLPGHEVSYGEYLTHGEIVLGNRLDNPYTTANMKSALAAVYPSKAGSVSLATTDYYVRFLPESDDELQAIIDSGIDVVDHPLDYEIKVEGDYYRDKDVCQEEDDMTWQYAVVPSDYEFPVEVVYEVLDECYIPDLSGTKGDGIDWEAVERKAYFLTGNGDMLQPQTKAEKFYPSGRVTIVDKNCNGGREIGVAGVRITCNSFVRMSRTYTDRDGYYTMPSRFSAKLRYRLVYKNEKGFSIGFNKIFTPASVSTLGKAGPQGIYFTVTEDSEDKLFRRCATNNAAYDYYSRCDKDDMNIGLPPKDLRIWIFPSFEASSTPMLHHGTLLSNLEMSRFWNFFFKIVRYFLPDITIGTKNGENYADIYSSVVHELAHASHFSSVGLDYWNKYIGYIMRSYFHDKDNIYGTGSGEGAGYCQVGEMWAYYLSSVMYQERYGGYVPTFGNSYWFRPQILRYLDDRGVTRGDIYEVLDSDVNSGAALKYALMASLPQKSNMIEQAFAN